MHLKNIASKRALLAGVSIIAALATTTSVQAACTANGVVTCTGDNQSFAVTSDAQTIIAESSTVTGSGLSAIRLNSSRANLRIDGTINATGAAAITVQNGDRVFVTDPYAGASPLSPYVFPYYYPTGRATIVVGEKGKISGDVGIWIERSSGNFLGDSTAAIDNSGLITATSGSAIRGAATNGVYYSSIVNRESGIINGIASPVTAITNAGLIDGRSDAALTFVPKYDPFFLSYPFVTLTNSGTITSTAGATIVAQQNPLSIANSGTIANSNGGLSIDARSGVTLTNSGTIDGTIVTDGSSTIDSRLGTINGDVLLGAGDDVIIAGLDGNGRLRTGITGRVDGGAGNNAVALSVGSDVTFAGTPTLPTNFSKLRAALENKAILTLGMDFVGATSLSVSGAGTLINKGRIETQGRAIDAFGLGYPVNLSLRNEGTIKATLSNATDAAVSTDGVPLTNDGTIEGIGGAGVLLKTGSGTRLVNSGSISASGGAAVLFSGGYSSNGTLENKTGGIIRGDTNAISILPDSSLFSYSATTIINAGSITGHVDLSASSSTDRFVMQQGGTVSGDVRLGAGDDLYVLDGTIGADGFRTGISGVLDGGAGSDQLIARVKSDAAIALGNYVNFETVGLDIASNALVKLTGAIGDARLNVYGRGSVDSALSISRQNAVLIDATSYGFAFPGDSSSNSVQTGTTIISRGVLSATFDANAFGGSAILLDQLDRFTNAGSITLTQAANVNGTRAAAISGGKEIVNTGDIVLNGGNGIAGALAVVNSGTIGEAAGATGAVGVSTVRDLTNSGTIRTSGVAVFTSDFASSTIRNSGTIQSSGAQAIRGGYSSAVIANAAGGTITGRAGFDAIALAGGAVGNAGTINGNVNLRYSPFGGISYASGAYVDRGGTLNGALLFGSGNDIFVTTSDTPGVQGVINGGDGIDTFIRSYDTSRTVDLGALPALPISFERRGVGAQGADTVVTLAASNSPFTQPLTLIGDGTIVNLATFTATNNQSARLLTLGSAIDPRNVSGAGSTLRFINRGTITNGIGGYAQGFDNETTISNRISGATAVQLTASSQDSLAFRNSGLITSPDINPFFYGASAVSIQGAPDGQLVKKATIDNNGTIRGGLSASLLAATFSFSNSGTIQRDKSLSPSVLLSIGQNYGSGIDVNADSATIDNSGTLTSSLTADIAAKALAFSNSGTIGTSLQGAVVSLSQSAHQTDDATKGMYGAVDQNSFTFANSGTLNGGATLYSSATSIAVTNTGIIETPAGSVELDDGVLEIEAGSQGSQTITFNNSGRINTGLLGASGVVIESNARSVEQMTNGFDETAAPIDGEPTTTVTVKNSGIVTADGGASYQPETPQPYPWYPVYPANLTHLTGLSITASSGGVSSIIVTNEAGGVISAAGATRNAADPQQPVVAGLETIGSTAVFAKANQVSLANAGTIRGLAGGIVPASLLLESYADYDFAGKFLAGAIHTIDSADTITNLSTGLIFGSVDLGAMNDRMANFGTINGDVYLGEGDDRFTHGLRAIQNGIVDGGAGTDALTIDINGGGLLDQATLDKFVQFESQSITGTGTITTNGPLGIDSLILRDANLTLAAGQTLQTASDISIVFAEGTNSLINLGTIKGGLSFAGGTNSIVNQGSIAGPISLGTGNSQFTVGAGCSVSGPVIAGGADDLLILAASGTDQAPQELRLSAFAGFERTQQTGGTLALSGDYRTGQLTLPGGRFIGRTGSVLNAASVIVTQGATFGSAGTVNGNIVVQGTLSPGASPGTMTVNGNVALVGSSTTLFEMTPTVSDALIVNGALTIAPGATLKLTGNRPFTPGVAYKLITASDGINGSFTTVDKASSVAGIIRQGRQSIDLLGQFLLGGSANGQVTRTVDYLNSLLVAGSATSSILNAAPSLLLADGTVDPAIVARLNAESYASAAQIGIENGLAIASALRSATTSARHEDAGLFTFGQTLGGWRRLPGDAATGTSRADISTYGALAGIGIGSQVASLGAFVGYIDARQKIGALQAKTSADGLLAGVIAQAAVGGFNVAASLSYDGSKADTDRTLIGSSKVTSHYRLRSATADISLGRAFGLGDGWSIEPEIGFTHITSRRGSASETGDAAWALDVEGRRTKANFVRGALELHGSAQARISPWLSAGVLHQLSGTRGFATAAYANVPTGLGIAGVSRSETLATVGAGVNLHVSPAATLYFGANSEFGAQSSGESATMGFRLRF